VPRLDLGADPLPRSIPVALSHPRAARPGTFDGSIPPLSDWTYLFQGVRELAERIVNRQGIHPGRNAEHVARRGEDSPIEQRQMDRSSRRFSYHRCAPIAHHGARLGAKMWTSATCDVLAGHPFRLASRPQGGGERAPAPDSARARQASHRQKNGVKPKLPLTAGLWEASNSSLRA